MATVLELAHLAKDSYANSGIGPSGWTRQDSQAPQKGITGFFGSSYLSQQTNELVIAFRGSEGLGDDAIRDWLIADAAIVTKCLPVVQIVDAIDFTNRILSVNEGVSRVYICGHSLGGALAQIIAGNRARTKGISFNAPGMADHVFSAFVDRGNAAQVWNIRCAGDLVSRYGDHVGKAPITIGAAPVVSMTAAARQIFTAGTGGLFVGLATGVPAIGVGHAVANAAVQVKSIVADRVVPPHSMETMIAALGQESRIGGVELSNLPSS